MLKVLARSFKALGTNSGMYIHKMISHIYNDQRHLLVIKPQNRNLPFGAICSVFDNFF